jgi:Cu/Ag efflux pump CusA
MFGWITPFSLQFRIRVLALAAGIIAFGTINVARKSIGTPPESSPEDVGIKTQAFGLSAMESARCRS